MVAEPVLTATGVGKSYGGKAVLKDIDLVVPGGTCIAFIGHNGCGKSTLLRVLAGLVRETAGCVARRRGLCIGYVPEHFAKMALTPRAYIRHMARVEGMQRTDAEQAAGALFRDFFLDDMLDVPMEHLSKGSLQKVGVVQALLAQHDLLLLDEPLSGQDVDSQHAFVAEAKARLDSGATILLSCHEPFLVDRLAKAVYEIHGGTLRPIARESIRWMQGDVLTFARDDARTCPPLPPGCTISAQRDCLCITAPGDVSQALLRTMLLAGYVLLDFRREGGMRDAKDR